MDPHDRIHKSQLEEMFAKIRATTTWPIDGDMLWGYFFVDSDRAKLESAGRHLEGRGYRYVGITRDEDDAEMLFLHVERIETHSAETLDRRNTELYDLAEALGLESYDGMDVGLVPPLN